MSKSFKSLYFFSLLFHWALTFQWKLPFFELSLISTNLQLTSISWWYKFPVIILNLKCLIFWDLVCHFQKKVWLLFWNSLSCFTTVSVTGCLQDPEQDSPLWYCRWKLTFREACVNYEFKVESSITGSLKQLFNCQFGARIVISTNGFHK